MLSVLSHKVFLAYTQVVTHCFTFDALRFAQQVNISGGFLVTKKMLVSDDSAYPIAPVADIDAEFPATAANTSTQCHMHDIQSQHQRLLSAAITHEQSQCLRYSVLTDCVASLLSAD
jgi:hypothetical protein